MNHSERREGEAINLILCAQQNERIVALLELDEDSLRVARYSTEPPRWCHYSMTPEQPTRGVPSYVEAVVRMSPAVKIVGVRKRL